MAKKQTFVVGSTNPVTESRTDAQLNTAWNQYEVLKAAELDGVLNAMSAQTLIDSEEITNALDVYNITPDPNDNTQLKQLLTQMDNKIDQITSGGEIIGSFWYGKTTPGFTVPAPTDIGQTYVDFTTLNHYISNDGSTWTLNGTLTLPALQDAIVLVTSKFWDIIEQQDQYGGRAIWSHDLSQWIYYPTIINLSGYAHTALDNLTSVGQNIANWSSNVTNCITEIPQDIKLELSAGTLTLKAGSKVYVPNGVGIFDEITIASDLTKTGTGNSVAFLVYDTTINDLRLRYINESYSGSTTPTSSTNEYWYDTTNNRIGISGDSGSTWTYGCSLPLAVISQTSLVITSIDQVFNGFGYIGNCVFTLPGVKGLIPNGRNADGTPKNIVATISSVQVATNFANGYTVNSQAFVLGSHGYPYWRNWLGAFDTPPAVTQYYGYYNTAENKMYYAPTASAWEEESNCLSGFFSATTGQITNLNPKEVFQAVDNSDLVFLLNTLYPIGSIYLGTQSSCPLATLIPGSTWTRVQGRYLVASGTLAGTLEVYAAGNTISAGLPDVKGTTYAMSDRNVQPGDSGAFYSVQTAVSAGFEGGHSNGDQRTSFFEASKYNSIYGQYSTVKSPGYVVNVWRRDA